MLTFPDRRHRVHRGQHQPLPLHHRGRPTHPQLVPVAAGQQALRLSDDLLPQQRRRESADLHRRIRDLVGRVAGLVKVAVGEDSAAARVVSDY